MQIKRLIPKILLWRERNISDRQFILILSIVVGLASGLVAVIVKNMVHLLQSLLTHGFVDDYENYLYFIYPGVGLLLTVLIVKFVLKRRIGNGIANVLYAISKRNSQMPKSSYYASMITSILTVGFGGSVGLEGPTVSSSGGIGSNLSKLFRLHYKNRTLLLGCGAAGAMAGIFNAPIAAIVFALEVIMLDLTAASLIPLLMASVSAALTSSFIYGDSVLFNIEVLEKFTLKDIPFYILLGIATGMVSVYFSKVFWWMTERFERIPGTFGRLAVGAAALGMLIFMVPPLYGEGFNVINYLLAGNYEVLFEGSLLYDYRHEAGVMLLFLVAVVIFKVIATSVTVGAGGVGGIFAPSLFIGSAVGFVFAKALNLFEGLGLSERNFTLVGMGGILAGVLHAPLTALFLIAEITGGYKLVIPLMITSAISFLTSKYFIPHSLYTLQLAKKGELITHDKDKAVLTLMKLKSEVETDFSIIHPEASLGDLVKVVSHSKRNIFPVVDQEGRLEGIVLLDDIRKTMFQPELYDQIRISEIMSQVPEVISSEENMDAVMEKFNRSGAWNLPVIDNEKYVGFVSKSKLFNAYRQVLQNFTGQ